MPIEKRWLLRRAVAFAIDMTIVGIVVTIAAGLLQTLTNSAFDAPKVFSYTSCEDAELVPDEAFGAFGVTNEEAVNFQNICKNSNLGIITTYVTSIGVTYQPEKNRIQTYYLKYSSDSNGNPQPLISLSVAYYLLAACIFSFQISRNRKTIGKSLMSLSVFRDDNSMPDLNSSLRREFFKFSPLIAYGIFELVSEIWIFSAFSDLETPEEAVAELAPTIAETLSSQSISPYVIPIVLLNVAIAVFYVGSFVRWRGRTFWDQFAGLKLTDI